MKTLKNIIWVLVILINIWMVVSYAEILIKNLTNPVYSNWNMIQVFESISEFINK